MSVIQFKCKKCGTQEYIIKEVPNGSNVHKGLYCAKCGAWEKWLSKDDVVCGEDSMKQTTAKERVETEVENLGKRIYKLRMFLYGDKPKEFRVADEFLLREQLKAMERYYDVLIARLSIWQEL